LWCTLQLRGQRNSSFFSHLPLSALWSRPHANVAPKCIFFAHFQTTIPCLTSGRITITWFRNSKNSVVCYAVVFADFNTNRRHLGWCKRFTWLVLGSLAARKPPVVILGRLLKQSPITEYKHAHNMLELHSSMYKLLCFLAKKDKSKEGLAYNRVRLCFAQKCKFLPDL
jgi:hypothetical protein